MAQPQIRPGAFVGAARVSGSGSLIFSTGLITSIVKTGPGIYEIGLTPGISANEHTFRIQPILGFAAEASGSVNVEVTPPLLQTVVGGVAADLDCYIEVTRVRTADGIILPSLPPVPSVAPPPSSGNVTGPSSSDDEAIVRFDGTTGKAIDQAPANTPTIDDVGKMAIFNVLVGTGILGGTPVSGAGTRIMWIPAKAAFRAGFVEGVEWDDVNIGTASFATGGRNTASGGASTALGNLCNASGGNSLAVGLGCTASNSNAIAMGGVSSATGISSIALGANCLASNSNAVALGNGSIASGPDSTAVGDGCEASGSNSFAGGRSSEAQSTESFAMGTSCIANGEASVAMGSNSETTGDHATALGRNATAVEKSLATGARASARLIGTHTHASGRLSADGDAQTTVAPVMRQTTDAVLTELTLEDATPSSSSRLVLPDDTSWAFSILIVGRNTTAAENAAYKFEGIIKRDTGAATTALVGTVTKTILAEDVAAWDAEVGADAANGSLRVRALGEAAKTISWVARCELAEVTG